MTARIDPMTRYVIAANGCWLWSGPVDHRGYGRHGAPLAHRILYERLVGPIPAARELDHLCRVRPATSPKILCSQPRKEPQKCQTKTT